MELQMDPVVDTNSSAVDNEILEAPRLLSRTPRACDRCRRSKLRCDGRTPCHRCAGLPVLCAYLHQPRRRGRIKRKGLPAGQSQDRSMSNNRSVNPEHLDSSVPYQSPDHSAFGVSALSPNSVFESNTEPALLRPQLSLEEQSVPGIWSCETIRTTDSQASTTTEPRGTNTHWPNLEDDELSFQDFPSHPQSSFDFAPAGIGRWNDLTIPVATQYQLTSELAAGTGSLQAQNGNTTSTSDPLRADGSLVQTGGFHNQPDVDFPSHINAYAEGVSLCSLNVNEAQKSFVSSAQTYSNGADVRYPVLIPLLRYISNFMRSDTACDLLDYYFLETTNSNFLVKPHSPYVLSHTFRKQSFLASQSARSTSPALLCSILHCALKTIDTADLDLRTSSRAEISKGLWETCLRLLGPLAPAAVTSGADSHLRLGDEIASGPDLDAAEILEQDMAKSDLDTFITYLHIGTIVAAGSFKGNSPVWWIKATDLAFEIGLNKESETLATFIPQDDRKSAKIARERQEERCRSWWLLYIIDRHIALSLNRQPLIDQTAGDGLHLPLDDNIWQGPGFAFVNDSQRSRAFPYKMTGIGLFGYFLPLMRILGEIIAFRHAEDGNPNQEALKKYILSMLHVYEESANDLFELLDQSIVPTDVVRSVLNGESSAGTDTHLMPRIVFYYSSHIVHVLYILLLGKWDPIVMLEAPEHWSSSPDFIACCQHAVAGAKTVSQILALDPELNFIPYLWGIYLLQGSFMLLVFAERIEPGFKASPQTIMDCETIVHAHEVCVATLSTEYQRNIRRVLRWALQSMRGRESRDIAQRRARISRSLLVYRWNKDGRGLGL